MAPLKLFGGEPARHSRWQNLVVDVQNRDVRTARLDIGYATASRLIFGIENLAVLWLGARLVLDGQGSGSFTVGMLFAFIGYKTQFATRMPALVDRCVELKMLGLHAERLADIALHEPEPIAFPGRDLAHLPPRIELRNVSFRHGDGEPWVLRHVDTTIEPDDHVAITGPSGAGKTTLLKIVLGLLKPTEGEVLYGGIPVHRLGEANVRRQFGTVMQDDVLLAGSLADNIAFFEPQPDAARIEACARAAQVHGDIACMPMGYHTPVGDLGRGLSGGQRQRLLLARALYRRPRVLLLDEATSHLDIAGERAVMQALAHLRLTRIVIAHRPETIAGAARVLELRGGRLDEPVGAVVEGEGGGAALLQGA
jgi:ATP-binding cassette subfamily B protein RaxB